MYPIKPYGGWLLEHLLVPNLRWRPGEANAKLRKVRKRRNVTGSGKREIHRYIKQSTH